MRALADTRFVYHPRKPVAICAGCGAVSHSIHAIGEAHLCRGALLRRRAAWQSALSETDWQACPACRAKGQVQGQPCEQCGGIGWLCQRRA